jgi:hypothetical protein
MSDINLPGEGRNLLLNSILKWMHRTVRKRMSVALLVTTAQTRGWESMTEDQMFTELESLRDLGHVEMVDQLSGELSASVWRMTATGINYVMARASH